MFIQDPIFRKIQEKQNFEIFLIKRERELQFLLNIDLSSTCEIVTVQFKDKKKDH